MFVSYILRLRTDRRESPREFLGEVEAVASGRKSGVTGVSELMTFVESTIDEEMAAINVARVELDGAT